MTDWLDVLDSLEREATSGPWHSGHTQDGIFSEGHCIAADVRNLKDEMLIPVLRNHARELIDATRELKQAHASEYRSHEREKTLRDENKKLRALLKEYFESGSVDFDFDKRVAETLK